LSLGFFFQAEDGIRDFHVTGVQTCALPISAVPRLPWSAWKSALPSKMAGLAWGMLNTNSERVRFAAWARRKGMRWIAPTSSLARSEERRVGKECRWRWPPEYRKHRKTYKAE